MFIRLRPASTSLNLALLAIVLVACVQGTIPPTPTPTVGLSIGAPFEGQTVAGTFAVVAGGIGGSANNLSFTLGSLSADDAGDGTATLNTRTLADGNYTLEATATIRGNTVSDSISLTVTNNLPNTGTVGPDGGTLKSDDGSYATLPAGALAGNVTLTLEDTTQQQILDDFGVDYAALGVTFLGALTVDAAATSSEGTDLPVQVDLAGWTAAVKPTDDVVMFNVLPDQNGDGIGELTFAAAAQATPDGSVITRPTPGAEIYGFGSSATSLRRQQTSAARPGELIELQGRGLTPHSVLGNTARFSGGTEILVAPTDIEEGAFNPLQSIVMAVPALGQGNQDLTLKNGASGFESDPLTLQIGSLGSGTQATWDAFIAQLDSAVAGVTTGRSELLALGSGFIADLGSDATLRAMVANSDLVSAANLTLLEGIAAGSYSATQRDLVRRHALLLDALAVTAPTLATSAADLASLLMVATPTDGGSSLLSLRGQQAGGGSCASPGTPIFWGSPTGMGGASSGSCGGGGAGGGSGGGTSPIRSHRLGGYGPVAGALIRVLTPDGSSSLSPFTAVTFEAGEFYIPFLPQNEPFLIRGFDPATGDVAEAFGISGATGEKVEVTLAFAPTQSNGPVVDFTISEVADDFAGAGHYRLEASVILKDEVPIVSFLWELDGIVLTGRCGTCSQDIAGNTEFALLRNGSYTVRLTVLDDLGLGGSVEKTIVVSDLPYPYGADTPQRVNLAADGSEAIGTTSNSIGVPAYPSDDGRYVLFGSGASNLVPADTNGQVDIFLKDVQTDAIERVNLAEDGSEANDRSGLRGFHLAGSGRHVAYYSEANNLSADCVSAACSYVLDRDTTTLTAVQGDTNSPLYADPVLSPDERFLAFRVSSASGCGAPTCTVIVEELATGIETVASAAADGTAANASITAWGFTGDGGKLVFSSRADNLVPDDTNGVSDIFVKDLDSGAIERVSVTQGGVEGDNDSFWASISRDGRYVAFSTDADNLMPGGDAGGNTQIVRKDLTTGAIELVSRNALGQPGNEDSYSVSISANGRYVVFGGYASDLVPGVNFDPNCSCGRDFTFGYSYVTDMDTGQTSLLSYNGSGWLDADDTTEPVISADGRYVVFTSAASNLIAGDTNFERDVFRVENPLWEAAP